MVAAVRMRMKQRGSRLNNGLLSVFLNKCIFKKPLLSNRIYGVYYRYLG
ncbi:hypothetical protein ANACAC_02665 [Anaerostipes caccae L1-92]|uniref:Uncharacterized protein n=1 Tax=Anaerostipes caccae (strain DSM 14662 / CCUG 47493 / JCM 13470 / NCIMB 13811 / L1-92) TaxID=411490 RepID=B0MGF4_ANACD|nr:hypothetical protein ANACAC_02665 [Anaerostipes caccae L1-92]